jgi:hypothetical protein
MPDSGRGEVKRLSLEVLYSTGQLKQVHIPIGGVPKWEGAGLVVWSEAVLRDVVFPDSRRGTGGE